MRYSPIPNLPQSTLAAANIEFTEPWTMNSRVFCQVTDAQERAELQLLANANPLAIQRWPYQGGAYTPQCGYIPPGALTHANNSLIENLIIQRQAAKAGKDWALSDRLRAKLNTHLVIVEDSKYGATRWFNDYDAGNVFLHDQARKPCSLT